jgi:hypothetical protein
LSIRYRGLTYPFKNPELDKGLPKKYFDKDPESESSESLFELRDFASMPGLDKARRIEILDWLFNPAIDSEMCAGRCPRGIRKRILKEQISLRDFERVVIMGLPLEEEVNGENAGANGSRRKEVGGSEKGGEKGEEDKGEDKVEANRVANIKGGETKKNGSPGEAEEEEDGESKNKPDDDDDDDDDESDGDDDSNRHQKGEEQIVEEKIGEEKVKENKVEGNRFSVFRFFNRIANKFRGGENKENGPPEEKGEDKDKGNQQSDEEEAENKKDDKDGDDEDNEDREDNEDTWNFSHWEANLETWKAELKPLLKPIPRVDVDPTYAVSAAESSKKRGRPKKGSNKGEVVLTLDVLRPELKWDTFEELVRNEEAPNVFQLLDRKNMEDECSICNTWVHAEDKEYVV